MPRLFTLSYFIFIVSPWWRYHSPLRFIYYADFARAWHYAAITPRRRCFDYSPTLIPATAIHYFICISSLFIRLSFIIIIILHCFDVVFHFHYAICLLRHAFAIYYCFGFTFICCHLWHWCLFWYFLPPPPLRHLFHFRAASDAFHFSRSRCLLPLPCQFSSPCHFDISSPRLIRAFIIVFFSPFRLIMLPPFSD